MGLQFQHAAVAFRTFCGEGALNYLPKELDRLGVTRAVLIYGASMGRNSVARGRVESVLGARLAGSFDGVKEHSPVPSVESAVHLLDDLNADCVVAVGGGSAVVTARAATMLLAEGRSVRDLCTTRQPDGRMLSPKLLAPKMPQWVVATTPTTAYAKAGSALLDPATGERLALYDPKARAQGVFFDPDMALTAPSELALASGLNALSMSIEGLQATTGDPLAVALFAHALRILKLSLLQLRSEPDNPEPRLQSMVAALLAGQGSDFAGGGLAQVLSHAAGPRSSTSNGVLEAMLLIPAMRYNSLATNEGLAVVAEVFTSSALSDGALDRCASSIEMLLNRLGVPSRLRDVGVARESIPDIAHRAMGDWAVGRLPRAVGEPELTALLANAW